MSLYSRPKEISTSLGQKEIFVPVYVGGYSPSFLTV